MAVSSKKFQAPKGTRDFYPQDMAVRRYIENVWRTVSINHGFDEVEGPTFENLDLYTHKSGPGIVSEIFQVFSGKDEAELAAVQRSGQAAFALRPEFTPTLARMVAAQADSLPKPIKWFAIPTMFRAERPQRGRLREHIQWNVDLVGDGSPRADADVIATAVRAIEKLGLQSKDITVKISHRELAAQAIRASGVHDGDVEIAMGLLDKRDKMAEADFHRLCRELGFDFQLFSGSMARAGKDINQVQLALEQGQRPPDPSADEPAMMPLWNLIQTLAQEDVLRWCEFDSSIVRGLAYYTGTVFEIHEATGAHRAIAGGGRYDNLIESFGGPSLPACGFGMGDVVLGNILHDKGLLPEDVYMAPLRPHAFVIAADDQAAAQLPKIVADLRKQGFHVRHSYKTTRNVGKLLSEADRTKSRFAVILGKELAEGNVALKNLQSGEQREIKVGDLPSALRL